MRFKMKPLVEDIKRIIYPHFMRHMVRIGAVQCALALETDKLDTIPESQRGWYEEDAATKKFKLNPAKIEIEDTSGLKTALDKERGNVKAAKEAAKKQLEEFAKKYEGIDPEKTRQLMSKFDNADEADLIAAGKIDEVIERRMTKHKEAVQKDLDEAADRESGALEVAATFMDRVLDNQVRAAAAEAGVHPSAVEDALLRARTVFSIDDDGNAVQFEDEEEESLVLGKDGKTPYSLAEWFEDQAEKSPHWFPAGASGGGAPGSKTDKGGAKTMKRAAFDALDHVAKAAKMKEGIKVID